MPFERSRLPWVRRSERSFAQTADKIEEEDELGGSEEDGGIGDEEVERNGFGEEDARGAEGAVGTGNSGELGVVAGFAGEAGEASGDEEADEAEREEHWGFVDRF